MQDFLFKLRHTTLVQFILESKFFNAEREVLHVFLLGFNPAFHAKDAHLAGMQSNLWNEAIV